MNSAVWDFVVESLSKGSPVALLTVVDSVGSSPGRAGFSLALTAHRMAGSIGGGPMERRLVDEVRARLGSVQSGYVTRQIHESEPEEPGQPSGMICSGEQTIVVTWLGDADLVAGQTLANAARVWEPGVLRITPDSLTWLAGQSRPVRRRFDPSVNVFEDDWGRQERLHVIGSGHCGRALCRWAASLGFEVWVYDDRPELSTFVDNNDAHRRIELNSYADLRTLIPSGDSEYVCVMTFGYKTDDQALRALFGKRFRYWGVLGSRAKLEQLLATYRAEGVDDDVLRRLHAPMGVPIHSHTPDEIAVSIAAQLIRERNEPARRES